MVLKAYERLRISRRDIALLSSGDTTSVGIYEVGRDSITKTTLMVTAEGSSQPVTVECPDGDHLVLVSFPVPGRFAYRRVRE